MAEIVRKGKLSYSEPWLDFQRPAYHYKKDRLLNHQYWHEDLGNMFFDKREDFVLFYQDDVICSILTDWY